MRLPQPPRNDDVRFDDWTAQLQKHVSALTPDNLSLKALGNYANDAAAATGGVQIGSMYRNGSALMVRVS